MRYSHRDGARSASKITVPGCGSVDVEEDGTFECDPSEEIHDRLVELGHEPVESDDDPADADAGEAEADDESDLVALDDLTEDEILGLSYAEKQSYATLYDHINGNQSAEKLAEELIKQRRADTEE